MDNSVINGKVHSIEVRVRILYKIGILCGFDFIYCKEKSACSCHSPFPSCTEILGQKWALRSCDPEQHTNIFLTNVIACYFAWIFVWMYTIEMLSKIQRLISQKLNITLRVASWSPYLTVWSLDHWDQISKLSWDMSLQWVDLNFKESYQVYKGFKQKSWSLMRYTFYIMHQSFYGPFLIKLTNSSIWYWSLRGSPVVLNSRFQKPLLSI
jgi:hypothetical protein